MEALKTAADLCRILVAHFAVLHVLDGDAFIFEVEVLFFDAFILFFADADAVCVFRLLFGALDLFL